MQVPPVPSVQSPEVLVLSPTCSVAEASVNSMNNTKKFIETKLKNCQVDFVRQNSKTKKLMVGFRNKELRSEG